MFATDKIALPPDDAERDVLIAFCKEHGIRHHWKLSAPKLQLLIRTWAIQNNPVQRPKLPGVLAQHRGNIDFIKKSADPGLVEGRKEMLKALLGANRTQTTMAYHLRVYIEALEEKVRSLTE